LLFGKENSKLSKEQKKKKERRPGESEGRKKHWKKTLGNREKKGETVEGQAGKKKTGITKENKKGVQE